MMLGCIDALVAKSHPMFSNLDIGNPYEGGVKFETFKAKVQELVEELGSQKELKSQGLYSIAKQLEEEDKRPESPKKSTKAATGGTPKNLSKKLTFDEPSANKNLESPMKDILPLETSISKTSYIVPHVMNDVSPASDISEIERFLLDKFRANPEAMSKLESALNDKRNADRARDEAKRRLIDVVVELTEIIARDDQDEVEPFNLKRPKHDDTGK